MLAGVAVIAATAAYVIFHRQTHMPDDLRSAAEQLLQGRTHWITFQNRLLAPLLIEVIRTVTGCSWLQGFYALVAACLGGGAGLLLWRSWRDTGKSTRGLQQIAAWFLFAALLNHQWSYPWDFTGALLFLLLVVWAKDRFRSFAAIKSWRLAALLVALALNRESSLFVLAALGLAGLATGYGEGQRLRAWAVALGCAVAGLANVAAVLLVRQTLFVFPTRPPGGGREMASGNFNQLGYNWQIVTQPEADLATRLPAIVIIALLVGVAAVWTAQAVRARFAIRGVSPGLLFARFCLVIGTGAALLFADASELRVYFEFIPMGVVLLFESKAWQESHRPMGLIAG